MELLADRQRLDAESVRDAILAAAGKLDLTMGGEGFRDLFTSTDRSAADYAVLANAVVSY